LLQAIGKKEEAAVEEAAVEAAVGEEAAVVEAAAVEAAAVGEVEAVVEVEAEEGGRRWRRWRWWRRRWRWRRRRGRRGIASPHTPRERAGGEFPFSLLAPLLISGLEGLDTPRIAQPGVLAPHWRA
jgi:hypothetical protein